MMGSRSLIILLAVCMVCFHLEAHAYGGKFCSVVWSFANACKVYIVYKVFEELDVEAGGSVHPFEVLTFL